VIIVSVITGATAVGTYNDIITLSATAGKPDTSTDSKWPAHQCGAVKPIR
jgi:hypothetical protein